MSPYLRRCHPLLVLLLVGIASCRDAIGPDADGQIRLLLDFGSATVWKWAPTGDEVVYSTPFDWPYDGPPTRIEAVSITSGAVRILAQPPDGGYRIIPTRIQVEPGFVYYSVASFGYEDQWLWRAPLTGQSEPQMLMPLSPGQPLPAASPDGSKLALVHRDRIVLRSLTDGSEVAFPVQTPPSGFYVRWSPDSRQILAVQEGWSSSGTLLQLFDSTGAQILSFIVPAELEFPGSHPLADHIAWDGNAPKLFGVAAGRTLLRFHLTNGSRDQLAELGNYGPDSEITWNHDHSRVAFWRRRCVKERTGLLGTSCVESEHQLFALSWAGRAENLLFELRLPGPIGSGPNALSFSPSGRHVAFHHTTTKGTGLHIHALQ